MVQTQREDASMEALFEDAIAACTEQIEQLEVQRAQSLSKHMQSFLQGISVV